MVPNGRRTVEARPPEGCVASIWYVPSGAYLLLFSLLIHFGWDSSSE